MTNNNTTTLLFAGDSFLKAKDGSNPLTEIAEIFHKSDIVCVDVETSIANEDVPLEKRTPIKVGQAALGYLIQSGTTIVNFANNHSMDYGWPNLKEAMTQLNQRGLFCVGANKDVSSAVQPAIINKNGTKFAFLAFSSFGILATKDSPGCAPLDQEKILGCISEAKENSDVVVVMLHWGVEYVAYPSPDQQSLARKIIDCGATLVVGHHSHVIQGIEKYKNGLIAYSLGNFNFWADEGGEYETTNQGILLQVKFLGHNLDNYGVQIVEIDPNFKPVICSEPDLITKRLELISKPLTPKMNPIFWYETASLVYLPSQFASYMERIKNYGLSHLCLFAKWLITAFTFKMFLGFISHKIKSFFHEKNYQNRKKHNS